MREDPQREDADTDGRSSQSSAAADAIAAIGRLVHRYHLLDDAQARIAYRLLTRREARDGALVREPAKARDDADSL